MYNICYIYTRNHPGHKTATYRVIWVIIIWLCFMQSNYDTLTTYIAGGTLYLL